MDLVIFTEDILNGKPHFLCNDCQTTTKVYLGPCETYTMELLAEITNDQK